MRLLLLPKRLKNSSARATGQMPREKRMIMTGQLYQPELLELFFGGWYLGGG